MRPNSMTDQNNASVVSGVAYGVANEMLQMTYNGGTETRTYNTMFQLTNISGLGRTSPTTSPPDRTTARSPPSRTPSAARP